MKTFGKILFWLFVVTLYLNIGWAIGTYVHNHVFMKAPVTTAEKIFSVDGLMTYSDKAKKNYADSLQVDQVAFMFCWPGFVVVTIGAWIIKGAWLLLWLVFGGGVAKLLGVG